MHKPTKDMQRYHRELMASLDQTPDTVVESPQTHEVETLPDMSQELASMGRGSMQRRIEQLQDLIMEMEYACSFIDRSPLLRVTQARNLVQQARAAGIVTRQPR